jgi:hypothetical protein
MRSGKDQILEISNGSVTYTDFASYCDETAEKLEERFLFNPTFLVNDKLIILIGTRFAVIFSLFPCRWLFTIPIDGELPISPRVEKEKVKPTPGYPAGITDDNILPVTLKYVFAEAEVLGFLKIDLESRTAHWIDPKDTNKAISSGKADTVCRLNLNSLPEAMSSWRLPAFINSAMRPWQLPAFISSSLRRQDCLYIHTNGEQLSPKWGYDYSVTAKVNYDGDIGEKIFWESHIAEFPKKRGVAATFTTSTNYAIFTPIYKNCPYKGKQRLYNLEGHHFVEFSLPKGYAKARLIDHIDDTFWLKMNTNDGTFLMACEAV